MPRNEKVLGLAPMLKALGVKQEISFDDCLKLWGELRAKTGANPPPFELSGNEWCALVNLAVARHGHVVRGERGLPGQPRRNVLNEIYTE